MLDANGYQAMAHRPVRDGDLVSLYGDGRELYSVILVREGRCWLRSLQTGVDALSSVGQCRRIGREADVRG